MTIPPVPRPAEFWELSVVHPWQGNRLVQLASSRPVWSRREGGNGAPVKYGWEDVAFQTSRDLVGIREVKFLGTLE